MNEIHSDSHIKPLEISLEIFVFSQEGSELHRIKLKDSVWFLDRSQRTIEGGNIVKREVFRTC